MRSRQRSDLIRGEIETRRRRGSRISADGLDSRGVTRLDSGTRRGPAMNPTAIESHLKLVLAQWAVIIVVAWAFGRLGKRLGQPLAVGEILGGILLGPSALGWVWPEGMRALFPVETQQSLQLLAKLGLILLMFQVGMEFDYGHLTTRSRTVVAVSLMGIVAPFVLGLALGPWLHREFAPEANRGGFLFFVCIALSISALPIMGRILLEWKLERTAVGVVAISSAALDDVVGWILLAAATALVTAKFTWGPLVLQVVGLTVFFLILTRVVGPALRRFWRCSFCLPETDPQGQSLGRWFACLVGRNGPALDEAGSCPGRPACGLMPQPVSPTHMPPTFLAVLLVVLFGCSIVTNRLGVFSIFGAFLLGVSLHQEATLVRAWREKFAGFVLVALVPIFFTNTGLRTEIGSLTDARSWFACGLVLAAAVVGKFGGCYGAALVTGQSWRDAGGIAALMNTRALMGLVAINIGADLGLLPRQLFTMFVIMALVTTVMAGPLLRWFLPASDPHPR